MKIVISTTSFGKEDDAPLKLLNEKGVEVHMNPYCRKLTAKEVRGLIADVDGLIAGTEPLTAEVLEHAKRLKVISRCGTGLDNVDLDAAKSLGIQVLRTPEAPAAAVAELALGFMMDALRKISYMDRCIRGGKWEKKMGNLLAEATVGIIGTGFIGRKLAGLLQSFNCKIYGYDVCPDSNFSDKCRVEYLSLDRILSQSDIVSVHLPLTPETRGMFDAALFGTMKKGAIFINTSRAEIVDESALYEALQSKLGHACIDVFSKEPYVGELRNVENVTLTCHAGAYAREARSMMEMESAVNVLKGLGI